MQTHAKTNIYMLLQIMIIYRSRWRAAGEMQWARNAALAQWPKIKIQLIILSI